MNCERQILRMPLDACPMDEVSLRMKKHAGIDLAAIPAKYGDSVDKAKAYMADKISIAAVYQIFKIDSIGEDSVTLENGTRFTGGMVPRICKGAEYVACFVATLPSFNDIRDTMGDIMEDYFLDVWGTVYAECGTAMVERSLKEQLLSSGYRSASAWNPGQHRFELCNQRPLFELLKPEEIGCVLDKHMRMIPFKSTSGIIPILKQEIPEEQDLIPCDFCDKKLTCPASRARKQADI